MCCCCIWNGCAQFREQSDNDARQQSNNYAHSLTPNCQKIQKYLHLKADQFGLPGPLGVVKDSGNSWERLASRNHIRCQRSSSSSLLLVSCSFAPFSPPLSLSTWSSWSPAYGLRMGLLWAWEAQHKAGASRGPEFPKVLYLRLRHPPHTLEKFYQFFRCKVKP